MKKYRKKQNRKGMIIAGVVFIVLAGGIGIYAANFAKKVLAGNPEELLVEYMGYIENREYEKMFSMIDIERSSELDKTEFIERNSKIYEGIEVINMEINNILTEKQDGKTVEVSYTTSFDTVAGAVEFDNTAMFSVTTDGCKLIWQDSLIFPDLLKTDKIQVSTAQAQRGEILDRNEKILAGKGTASSVGIVPGKLEDKDAALKSLSELLEISVESIENKLEASWVKEDSFVPIATIPKVQEIQLMTIEPDESVLEEYNRQTQLLDIQGVMLSDVEVRSYALGEAAAHLIGYVQKVTAEDLENHAGEGYNSNSEIGRTGMESLYETELKGTNGCEISIVDENGNKKSTVAKILKEDGENIQLTIDSELQEIMYEQFKEDRGCSVAINPYTGEVLAMVSTPSYDNNDFIKGLSAEKWTFLNEDENKPLYNRFRQVWCPGSTFKPIIATIGLKTDSVDPNEDFGNVGLAWQKDSSWGSYEVTTLHAYEPVILKNAIIYSDNIYFAKLALKIGAENLEKSLNELGFNQEIPFEIVMSESQYSNTEHIETEIQLADSGYGQGQILVNPLHLASLYTAFLNNGSVIKPYLQYKEDATSDIWIADVFAEDTVDTVMEGLKGVINDPNGTGYTAYREDIVLAGKTGTAEIKATKDDTDGSEIGWFCVFSTETDVEKPILIVSMVEDVKGIGGSGYVVGKDKAVLEQYLSE